MSTNACCYKTWQGTLQDAWRELSHKVFHLMVEKSRCCPEDYVFTVMIFEGTCNDDVVIIW